MLNLLSMLTYLAIDLFIFLRTLELAVLVRIFFNNLNVFNKDSLGLDVRGCENLWFDVQFPGQKQKYNFAVMYHHPHNNASEFISALDEKLSIFDKAKSNKVYGRGDENLDLNSKSLSSSASEYLRKLQSHAYFSIITKPTCVTATSQTCIDHIFTNDSRSSIKPGVFIKSQITLRFF